jgi:ACS family glucarate transporter-like MFS transporter
MIGYGGAGFCYLAAATTKWLDPDNLFLFASFLILMGFMNDLIMAPAWAVCQDIGQDYAATVSGAMNMFGNLVGAAFGILVTGLLLKTYQGASGIIICFILYAIVYFVGVGLWAMIDPTKPILPHNRDTNGIEPQPSGSAESKRLHDHAIDGTGANGLTGSTGSSPPSGVASM